MFTPRFTKEMVNTLSCLVIQILESNRQGNGKILGDFTLSLSSIPGERAKVLLSLLGATCTIFNVLHDWSRRRKNEQQLEQSSQSWKSMQPQVNRAQWAFEGCRSTDSARKTLKKKNTKIVVHGYLGSEGTGHLVKKIHRCIVITKWGASRYINKLMKYNNTSFLFIHCLINFVFCILWFYRTFINAKQWLLM